MKSDVIIVGSGPAGLSAAVYCLRAGKQALVLEKEYEGTGQIAESHQVDNYLGLPEISGYDLGEKFRKHAVNMGASFLETEVIAIEKKDDVWQVICDNGEVQEAEAVIYTAGASHRKLQVSGEEEFASRGVSYCATCDGAFFRDKKVAVIGGGDTAVDDALYLSNICKKVYLVHRRNKFRCSDKKMEKLRKKENIEFVLEATVQSVTGDKKVEAITVAVAGKNRKLAVDGVFVAIGMEPVTASVKEIVSLDETGYVKAGEDGITDQPGFFVAGDVRTKALRQVVTAVADGANAAVSAISYLERE